MKILYVTPFLEPVIDILSGKRENEISTSPFFFYPWYKLIKKGHEVDFVCISNFNEEFNIKVNWFKKENILVNIYDPPSEKNGVLRIFRKIKRFLLLMYYTNKALKNKNYDFVYCKAFEGLAGNFIANLRGIPCGVRSFGTSAYPEILKYGILGAALRRPLEFITYRTNKKFLLVSDDGSNVEKVYESWKPNKKNYDYYAWKTGIKFESINELKPAIDLPKEKYLFFPARFQQWKRHDRILKVLNLLHEKGIKLHLYFAGPIDSQKYFNEIQNMVKVYSLNNYVHYLGILKQQDIKILSYHATANILMYDFANATNVFFEMLSIGSVIIGINDGKLNDYINGINGFLVNDEENAAAIVDEILENKYPINAIRENAITTAKEKVMSIDERFDKEVELIESFHLCN